MKRWEPIAYPGPDNAHGAATHRNFNQGTGARGSWLDAGGYQQLIDEACAIVEAAGFALDGTKSDQLLHAIRSGVLNWQVAGGTANALTVDLSPNLTAYFPGLPLRLLTGASPSAGPMTINVDGLGPKSLVRRGGGAMADGDVPAATLLEVVYDGTAFRCTSFVASDLRSTFNPVNLSVVNFDTSGSWTVPAGVFFAFIEAWGAGGGGGAGDGSSLGGLGGGGGLYAARYVAVTPGAVHTVTVGVGGNTSTSPGNAGGSGGSTSVGALLTAGGGGQGGAAGGSPGAGGTASAGAQIIVQGGGAFISFGANGSPGGNGARGAQGGQQGNSGTQPGGGAAGNTNVNSYGGQKGGNGRVTITYATP